MAVKRAIADAKELQSTLYRESGMVYTIDDSNVLFGRACIFGPKDTPYEDCPMIYDIEIPHYNVKTFKIISGDKSDNIDGISVVLSIAILITVCWISISKLAT